MKTIENVSIWDNGTVQQASVFNTYATNVILNTSATFQYSLLAELVGGSLPIQLTQGYLTMTGDAYTQWQTDNYAWDWVAQQLNLVITGEYIPPVPPSPVPPPTISAE
jgi:hypothetical protein